MKNAIDLQNQADAFMGIASAAIRGLVRRVEIDLEPSWREMRNIAWARIDSCESRSSYIIGLQNRIKDRSSEILGMLHKQQYARAFADNFVELLSATYISNMVQCKPISEGGAEQMLLDTHEIRTTIIQMLQTNPPPASYVKRVNTTLGKVEPLLKTLQVRPSPPEALVQAYLIHISDLSDANFRKVLDLKGIRSKTEQNHLIELFQMHKLSPRYKDILVEKSPLLTPLMLTAGASFSHTGAAPTVALQNLSALSSSAASSLSTANLPANMKFDASGIGNAIMDRFSSPNLGGMGTPREGTQSPPPVTDGVISPVAGAVENGAKLNENLKNIGRFFKRDLGGFGSMAGRFGSKPTSPTPPEDRR